MSSKSPTKKASRSLSKGGLTAREGLELLTEMNKDKNNSADKQKSQSMLQKGKRNFHIVPLYSNTETNKRHAGIVQNFIYSGRH